MNRELTDVRKKIHALKAMIENPHDFNYSGDEEIDVQWDTNDWKDHFYGSGDPADVDEAFIRNLSEYCFKAIEWLTEAVSGLYASLGGEVQEYAEILAKNPKLIELFNVACHLSDEDLKMVHGVASRFSKE